MTRIYIVTSEGRKFDSSEDEQGNLPTARDVCAVFLNKQAAIEYANQEAKDSYWREIGEWDTEKSDKEGIECVGGWVDEGNHRWGEMQ